jgi:hypothetical protein
VLALGAVAMGAQALVAGLFRTRPHLHSRDYIKCTTALSECLQLGHSNVRIS